MGLGWLWLSWNLSVWVLVVCRRGSFRRCLGIVGLLAVRLRVTWVTICGLVLG